MTAPKKKKTNPKPKAAQKATVTPQKGDYIAPTEITPDSAPEKPTKKKSKLGEILKKPDSEFRVGNENYAAVVKAFNKEYGKGYNFNRVPPYIFKTMLIRLRRLQMPDE